LGASIAPVPAVSGPGPIPPSMRNTGLTRSISSGVRARRGNPAPLAKGTTGPSGFSKQNSGGQFFETFVDSRDPRNFHTQDGHRFSPSTLFEAQAKPFSGGPKHGWFFQIKKQRANGKSKTLDPLPALGGAVDRRFPRSTFRDMEKTMGRMGPGSAQFTGCPPTITRPTVQRQRHEEREKQQTRKARASAGLFRVQVRAPVKTSWCAGNSTIAQ